MHKLLLLKCLFLGGMLTAQDLQVFEVFTDHAVLQRDKEHPIWGWTKQNRRVSVSLDGTTVRTKADRDGRWETMLPATEAGGPHTISISDGKQTLTLEDIYFGDVYLLSGQSNMEWRLAQSDPDSTRAGAIADPLIRQVLIDKTSADTPLDHIALNEPWKPGTVDEIADFSGVGAYFAHYLREAGITVPIGLLHSSWGGSRIEPWLSADMLDTDALAQVDSQQAESLSTEDRVRALYRREFPGQGEPPTEDRGAELGYLDDEVDVADWATVELPGAWESRGYTNVDGYFYYRREFTLTEAQAGSGAVLYLGPIDDGDRTYVNGIQVGDTPNAYSTKREYPVGADVLRAGKNTLAIRVFDGGGGGGFMGAPEGMYLRTTTGDVPLNGRYAYRIGEFRIGQGSPNQVPTLLYNAMIAPLRAWPLTGVLWYQGESNAGPGDAEAYADYMRTLVTSWRERFGQAELPFYWVQLANYEAPPSSPDEPGWAVLRASQTAATDLPQTGQAVITDIGEADDIHPKNKWEVGRRLSLHALRDVYGQEVQASSPVATEIQVEGDRAYVMFSEIGTGLMIRGPQEERYPIVKSLSVQDTEGQWHWAIGLLHTSTNRLEVINPAGTGIQAVRYAWFSNPDDANLFSREGLPVTPFELRAD